MIESLIGPAMSAAGYGLDIAMTDWKNEKQLKQQGKLTKQQVEGSKELSQFNADQAYDMWNKTNYSAQRKQLEDAGLNVGLLYSKGGAGGTTAAGSGGSVSGGVAQVPQLGQGAQLGLQTAQAMAAIELTKAQTNKTNVEAEKIGGVDTELGKAQITNLNVNATATEIENEYRTELREYYFINPDGSKTVVELTGNDQRALNDIINRNATMVQRNLNEQKRLQLPQELNNEMARVKIEAGKLDALHRSVENEKDKNRITEEMNKFYRQFQEKKFVREGDQYIMDKVQHNLDNTLSIIAPWYTPPTTTSTQYENYNDGEGMTQGTKTTRTKRGK